MVLLIAFGGTAASGVEAATIAPVSTLTEAQKNAMKSRIIAWPSVAGDTLQTGMWRTATAATVEPSVGLLATAGRAIPVVMLGATAGYVGWKIGTPAGGYVYRRITGQTLGGNYATADAGVPQWVATGASVYQYQQDLVAPAGVWRAKTDYNYNVYCLGTCTNPTYPTALAPMLAAMGGTDAVNTTTYSNLCGAGTVPAGSCHLRYRTAAQMARVIAVTPQTQTEYDAATYPKTEAGTTTTTVSDAQLQTALDAINAENDANQDASDAAAVGELRSEAGLNTPVPLLKPQPNEVYTAYITRLQNAGLVGTYTTTLEPAVLNGYGPSAVTRVQYVTNGTTTTLDPLQWPTSSPSLAPGTALTVRYNPTTATPVATSTGTASGNETGPAGSVPAIDWSPLNVGLGEKFPFGSFTWIKTLFNSFTQSSTLPCWTISRPPGLPAGDGYTVCVPANNYRGYSDPIMKLLVIVASIWFAGTWIVGWSRGETMDGSG